MVHKIIAGSALLFVLILVVPAFSFAQDTVSPLNDSDFTFDLNAITHQKIKQDRWIDQGVNYVIQRVITLTAQTIGVISILGFSAGGLLILMSAGSDELITKGKNLMKYSLLGLVFVLSAYLLVMTIQTLVTSIFKGF
ncbi:hypothetical protein HZA43_03465 [Candidatus Peregrinibacteria bacterium]|nr:hypothetical protein [Candidatus Peregrinibacteria bacterium]